jgi:hypothetical protein
MVRFWYTGLLVVVVVVVVAFLRMEYEYARYSQLPFYFSLRYVWPNSTLGYPVFLGTFLKIFIKLPNPSGRIRPWGLLSL